MPFVQFPCNVVDEEFVAGHGEAILRIEVLEVREQARKFMT
jgi:hypothetical protein